MRRLAIVLALAAVLAAAGLWIREPERKSEIAAQEEVVEREEAEQLAKSETVMRQISGDVRDGSQGIEGAEVCALCTSCSPAPDPICAVTDAAGAFRLTALPHEDHRLTAIARGYYLAVVKRAPNQVSIALEKGGAEIRGVVEDRFGGAIAGARVCTVEDLHSEECMARTTSDDGGAFALWVDDRGQAAVRAEFEGYAAASVHAFAPSERVRIVLTPESRIVGRAVERGTTRPIAKVAVIASDSWYSMSGEAESGIDGRFEIAGLGPGRYELQAWHDEWRGEVSGTIALGYLDRSDEVIVEMERGRTVRGRVVIRGSGAPCTKGSVTLLAGRDRAGGGKIEMDGSVRITGLKPGKLTVLPWCEDHFAVEENAELQVADRDLDGLTWEVEPGLSIAGRVLDPSGKAVSGASVDLAAKEYWGPQAESGEDGAYELRGVRPGRYSLRAWKSRPFERQRTLVEIELAPGESREGVDITIDLPPSHSLAGKVVDGSGQPIANVEARLIERGSDRHWTAKTSLSDGDGRFLIDELAAGPYTLTVNDRVAGPLRAPGSKKTARKEIDMGEQPKIEVTIAVDLPAGRISGRVIDESSQPLRDVFVSAVREEHERRDLFEARDSFELASITREDGTFELHRIGAGAYTLLARRPNGAEVEAKGVRAGQGVELVLQEGLSVAGIVVGPSGQPETAYHIWIRSPDQEHRREEIRDRSGRWKIDGLSPKKYAFDFTSPTGGAVEVVDLEDGKSREGMKIVLQATATVRGRFVDHETGEGVANIPVRVWPERSAGGRTGEATSDAQGRFEVRIRAGKVSVEAPMRDSFRAALPGYAGGCCPHQVDAAPASTVELPPVPLVRRPPGAQAIDWGFILNQPIEPHGAEDFALFVATVREGSPAARGGLKMGDTIVAVNGNDLSGPNHCLLLGLLTNGSPRVELGLAGGRSVVLSP